MKKFLPGTYLMHEILRYYTNRFYCIHVTTRILNNHLLGRIPRLTRSDWFTATHNSRCLEAFHCLSVVRLVANRTVVKQIPLICYIMS